MDLMFNIKSNTSEFRKGVGRTSKDLKDFKRSSTMATKSIQNGFRGATQGLTKFGGVGASVMTGMGGQFYMLQGVFKGVIGMIKGMTVGVKGLSKALISSGIGAIIVAIGAAVGALSSYFKNSIDGANNFNKAMSYIRGTTEKLKERFIDFGRKIVEGFKNPKQGIKDLGEGIKNNLVNRFRGAVEVFTKGWSALKNGAIGVGKSVKAIFNKEARGEASKYFEQMGKDMLEMQKASFQIMTGVDTEKIKEAGKEIRANVEASNRIAERENKLRMEKIKFLETEAIYQRDIAELNRIAADNEGDSGERQVAINKAMQLQNELSDQKVRMAREAYEIQAALNALGETGYDDLQKEYELKVAMIQSETDRETKLRKLQNFNEQILNTIRKESKEQAKFNEELAKSLDVSDNLEANLDSFIAELEKEIDEQVANEDLNIKVEPISDFEAWEMGAIDMFELFRREGNAAFDEISQQSVNLGGMIAGGLTDAVIGLTSAFGGLFSDTESGFKDVVTTALQAIQGIIQALLAQAIAGMIAGESSKGLIGLLTAAIGVSALIGLWQSKVPEFADGGLIYGKTLGIMGEYPGAGSNPEVVAPLNKLKDMIGDGNGGGGEVVFRIGNDELIGTLNRGTKKNQLI